MPNYSCGGCCWFLVFTLVALKAHIFHTVGRKYFPLVSFKRTWKNLAEAYRFCPISFKNGATVISQSTVKIVFFRCLTNPTLSSGFFKEMEMKIKISIFLVEFCCNLMILAKKPEVNWNFAKKCQITAAVVVVEFWVLPL